MTARHDWNEMTLTLEREDFDVHICKCHTNLKLFDRKTDIKHSRKDLITWVVFFFVEPKIRYDWLSLTVLSNTISRFSSCSARTSENSIWDITYMYFTISINPVFFLSTMIQLPHSPVWVNYFLVKDTIAKFSEKWHSIK